MYQSHLKPELMYIVVPGVVQCAVKVDHQCIWQISANEFQVISLGLHKSKGDANDTAPGMKIYSEFASVKLLLRHPFLQVLIRLL